MSIPGNFRMKRRLFRGTSLGFGYNFAFSNYEIEFEWSIKITSRWFVERKSEVCQIVMIRIADGECHCLSVHRQHVLYIYMYCLQYEIKAPSMITHVILLK